MATPMRNGRRDKVLSHLRPDLGEPNSQSVPPSSATLSTLPHMAAPRYICAIPRTAELRSSTRTVGSDPTEGERTVYKSTVPQNF